MTVNSTIKHFLSRSQFFSKKNIKITAQTSLALKFELKKSYIKNGFKKIICVKAVKAAIFFLNYNSQNQ